MTVLLVEDDIVLCNSIASLLTTYDVTLCHDFCDADAEMLIRFFDLYILDLQLPDGSGFDLCKTIRQTSCAPILILSVLDDESSVIHGLNIGADDYITKPFSNGILLARVDALLRRLKKKALIKSGDLTFDCTNATIERNNHELHLLPTEYKIAKLLIENYGALVTRDRLLTDVWDINNVYVEENTLSVNISRLRKKLGAFNNMPYIITQRGYGYRWGVKVEE